MNNKAILAAIAIAFVVASSFAMIAASTDITPSSDAADGEAEATITYEGESGEVTETGTFSEILEKVASNDGSKITLTKSGSFSKSGTSGVLWIISNNVTLDLNGYELNVSGGKTAIEVNGTLTLTDSQGTGKLNANGGYQDVISGKSGSSVTIDADIEYTTTSTSAVDIIHIVGSASSFTMLGGSITLNGAADESSALNAFAGNYTITGGTITSTGTDTYAVNTYSYTVMEISNAEVVGSFYIPRVCSISISGGTFSVAPDINMVTIPDGKFATISESDGMSVTDNAPSNPTASVGNVYYTYPDGRDAALAASVAAHRVTIYDAPENWTGSIDLPKMDDYVDVTMLNCAASATISVTTIDSCTVQMTDLGNDTVRYTAMIVPENAGAMIRETGVYYTSFEEAFEALESGQTVALLKDHKMSSTLYVQMDMTLDLNGKTLEIVSSGNSSGITTGDCNLVITDSSEGYSLAVDESTNSVTYDGGKIIYSGTVNNGAIYSQSFSSEIILDKGKLESPNARAISINGHVTINDFYISTGMDAIYVTGRGMSYDPTTLSITGGAIESSYGMVISGNGSKSATGDFSNTSIEISGGLIHATGTGFSTAIYHPQYGTLNITDGRIVVENGAGIVMRSGELNVDGGQIITKGTSPGSVGDAGNTVQPSAVVVDGSAGYPGIGDGFDAEITGGTFESDKGIQTITETKVSDDDESVVSVSGGTFQSGDSADTSVQPYMDPVCSFDSETGEVTIDESKIVVTNGDNAYSTFNEAIKAAQDGDTIVLAVSGDTYVMTENLTPRNGNHVTIDLDGKTLDFGTTYRILATSGSGGLTLENGTLKFNHSSPIQVLGCDLRFENCIIETSGIFPSSGYEFGPSIFAMFGYADANTTKLSSLYVGPDCEVVYNDGAEIGAYVVNVFENDPNAAYGVTIDFQGVMTGNIGLAFYINGTVNKTEGNVPQIHVAMPDDSKVSGGFYAAGYADWDIDSGYFEGSTPLSIKSGTFDISGGIFHATGEFNDPADANGNGSEETGAAISITTNDKYAGNVEMNVTGGTFTSDNGYAVYEGIAVNVDGTPAASASSATLDIKGGEFKGNISKGDMAIITASNKNVISGGSFSSDVSPYCADGFTVSRNSDGTYDVTESVTVTFVIGDKTTEVTIPVNTAVPADKIPELPEDPENYVYMWATDGGYWNPENPVYENVTVNAWLFIDGLSVSVSIDGGNASAVIDSPVEIDGSRTHYEWYLGEKLVSEESEIALDEAGEYLLSVMVYDTKGNFTPAYTQFTYRSPETPAGSFDIEHDGDSATVTVPGDTVIITSSGEHDDVDITLAFGDTADIAISGNVGSGAITVTAKPMTGERVQEALEDLIPDTAVKEDIRGVDVTVSNVDDGYGMWIKVKMGKLTGDGNGTFVASAVAYYIDENGEREQVDCYVQGTEVWILTDHNTEYVVIPTAYSETAVTEELPAEEPGDSDLPPFIPFPPEQGGDPVEVYPGQDGGSSDGRDDTMKVVAVAAAAVIAAILAIVLASTYRKN